MGQHYTAHISIKRVDEAETETDRYNNITKQKPRVVTDITELTVRDENYAGLVDKINTIVAAAH